MSVRRFVIGGAAVLALGVAGGVAAPAVFADQAPVGVGGNRCDPYLAKSDLNKAKGDKAKAQGNADAAKKYYALAKKYLDAYHTCLSQ